MTDKEILDWAKNREAKFKKEFEMKFPDFLYHSNFSEMNEVFECKCKRCGNIEIRNALIVWSKNIKNIVCCKCRDDELKKIREEMPKRSGTKKEIGCIQSGVRNARMFKNGQVDSSISLTKLAKRDDNKCYICGLPIDWNDYTTLGKKKKIGSKYPSIDHVIPISKGGTHTWDNVKLTHISCNCRKKNKSKFKIENNQMKICF